MSAAIIFFLLFFVALLIYSAWEWQREIFYWVPFRKKLWVDCGSIIGHKYAEERQWITLQASDEHHNRGEQYYAILMDWTDEPNGLEDHRIPMVVAQERDSTIVKLEHQIIAAIGLY